MPPQVARSTPATTASAGPIRISHSSVALPVPAPATTSGGVRRADRSESSIGDAGMSTSGTNSVLPMRRHAIVAHIVANDVTGAVHNQRTNSARGIDPTAAVRSRLPHPLRNYLAIRNALTYRRSSTRPIAGGESSARNPLHLSAGCRCDDREVIGERFNCSTTNRYAASSGRSEPEPYGQRPNDGS
jgi:hypothetical protein